MDPALIQIIGQIQIIKSELYKKYKPELIDGSNILTDCSTKNNENDEIRSKEYDQLMRQHRRLIYKNDIVAQQKAEAAMKQLSDQQKEEEMRTKLCLRVNIRSYKEETNEISTEVQKPWHKLSNNLKIQAILKFIEALSTSYLDDQINQLRYLLISSVSQRKLNKIADVDYDIDKGMIIKIPRLIQEDNIFKLLDQDDLKNCIGIPQQTEQLNEIVNVQAEKKLIKKVIVLKKK